MMIVRRANMLRIGILLFASCSVIILFFSATATMGHAGFPLDDAWIHQVYARNLAVRGEWAFNPGEPSGGSTSPLWSLLLSGAYIFSIQPVVWVALIGSLTLFGIGMLAEDLLRIWNSGYTVKFPWIGLFFILEWHLIWAALSGMETALFCGLILGVFRVLQGDYRRYWVAGLLIGLSTWIRPDGITLLGPAVFLVLFQKNEKKQKLRELTTLLGTFLLVFAPYLFFNLKFAGDIWPSTFLAKQAEYQAAVSLPIGERIGSLLLPFLAGGGVILIPGVLAAFWLAIKRWKMDILAMLLWMAGFVLLYAIRLPVSYQHGRYMIPAMVCFFLAGIWGMLELIALWQENRLTWIIKRFWIASLAVITIAFLGLGLMAYQTDVAIIQTEMVKTAVWIKQNAPATSRIAAHDIGALGYFSDRKVIDLAGLVNPEVIPIIRNETALSKYLDLSRVDFLVTFPGWYPELIQGKRKFFSTNGLFSPPQGGENMAVYAWH